MFILLKLLTHPGIHFVTTPGHFSFEGQRACTYTIGYRGGNCLHFPLLNGFKTSPV